MTSRRLAAVAALAIMTAVCGRDNPGGPTPSPTPTPPASTASLSGRVKAADGSPIGNARVDIVLGANSGQGTITAADGTYRFNALQQGTMTLRASAIGYVAGGTVVTLTGDSVMDLSLQTAALLTKGRVFDAITDAGLAGVMITGDGLTGISEPGGTFGLGLLSGDAAPRSATFTASGFLSRQTFLRVPGPDVDVSMIPLSFDVSGFNQMLRAPILRRWVTQPPLLVERRTLRFSDVNASSASALPEVMPDDDYDRLVLDLQVALASMTGRAAYSFASITNQASADGSTVQLLNQGTITVARLSGLRQATGFWGYGRWQSTFEGAIVSGIIMLDRDFDVSMTLFTLRAHELGHALGYNHVTGRASVMNSSATVAPTAFDLEAFRIAFQRPPGNGSPDIDPGHASLNRVQSGLTWGPPIK